MLKATLFVDIFNFPMFENNENTLLDTLYIQTFMPNYSPFHESYNLSGCDWSFLCICLSLIIAALLHGYELFIFGL